MPKMYFTNFTEKLKNMGNFEKYRKFWKISKILNDIENFEQYRKFWEISKILKIWIILKNIENLEKISKILRIIVNAEKYRNFEKYFNIIFKNVRNFEKCPEFWKMSRILKNVPNFEKCTEVWKIILILTNPPNSGTSAVFTNFENKNISNFNQCRKLKENQKLKKNSYIFNKFCQKNIEKKEKMEKYCFSLTHIKFIFWKISLSWAT